MTRTVLLGDVVDISSSKRIFYSEYVVSGVPFYRSKEIIEKAGGKNDISTELFISEERFSEIESKFGAPQEGDLLLTSVGTLGVPYLVQKNERFYFKDGNLTWFRNFKPDLSPNYLLYWLTSHDGKNELLNHTIGSTQKALTIQGLKKVKIPLPEIETQKKIADILGTIDEKIELNRKMNETLEQMGQALFRHYFIDNPEADKWEDQPVGSLIDSALGGDWGKEELDDKYSQEVRIIRGTDMESIKNGSTNNVPIRFIEEKKYETRKLKPDDVLIEISGGSNTQSTGRSIYIEQATIDFLGGSVIPASFCRVIRAKSKAKASTLFTFLEYLYSKGAMWDYQNRSTGISNFQYKFFTENALIKNVPQDIEEKFHSKVQPLIAQRAKNAQQIQTLTTLRDTLLPRLINGKIEV